MYSFPMFTDRFANLLLEEVTNYKSSGLPAPRPNSMNNYGLIVNDIGLSGMMTLLQKEYLQPIARFLYPLEGMDLTSHHSFMVQYRAHEDPGLDMHTDDSDVTFNVCLGRDFTGAGLTFCGTVGTPSHRKLDKRYQHEIGRCVVHLGSKRHGADDIATGERHNLIIWNHNQPFRDIGGTRSKYGYQREQSAPDLDCLSWTHDRDFRFWKSFPRGKRGQVARQTNERQAWCPPNHACYDSMESVFKGRFEKSHSSELRR